MINSEAASRLCALLKEFQTDIRNELESETLTTAPTGRTVLLGGFRGTGKSLAVQQAISSLQGQAGSANDSHGQNCSGSRRASAPDVDILQVRLHGPMLFESVLKPRFNNIDALTDIYLQIVAAIYEALRERIDEIARRRSYAKSGEITALEKKDRDFEEVRTRAALDLDFAVDLEVLSRDWQVLIGLETRRDFRRLALTYRLNQLYASLIAGEYKLELNSNEQQARDSQEQHSRWSNFIDAISKNPLPLAAGTAIAGLTSLILQSVLGFVIAAGALVLGIALAGRGLQPKTKSIESAITFVSKPKPSDITRLLPSIVQQFRSAGWPLVFVIDELDKIKLSRKAPDDPWRWERWIEEQNGELDTAIDWFFRYFKDTSSYGAFFIFVCHQEYLTHFEKRRRGPPSPAHNYFAYELLHFNKTEDMTQLAEDLLGKQKQALAPVVAFRGRYNPVGVRRIVKQIPEGPGNTWQDKIREDAHELLLRSLGQIRNSASVADQYRDEQAVREDLIDAIELLIDKIAQIFEHESQQNPPDFPANHEVSAVLQVPDRLRSILIGRTFRFKPNVIPARLRQRYNAFLLIGIIETGALEGPGRRHVNIEFRFDCAPSPDYSPPNLQLVIRR